MATFFLGGGTAKVVFLLGGETQPVRIDDCFWSETQPVRIDGFFGEALGRPAVFTYRLDTYRVYRGALVLFVLSVLLVLSEPVTNILVKTSSYT